METTLILEPDVADPARMTAAQLGKPVDQVVQHALRLGLQQLQRPASRAYCTNPHPMGVRPGVSLDNVQELLSEVEGEQAR